ncbi:hypothetical protein WJX81_005713 [Elliptochloris bilobata]|uniref:Magnesium transporter n=1 Tax=Elliptochloris bilobata TaxID=381761 RepID=A0AAW1QWP3_9CHLO
MDGTRRAEAKAAHFVVPAGPRECVRVDRHGNIEFLTIEKAKLAHELDLPHRDLRYIDPLVPLPFPSAILIREKAICVSLEHIRMVVGTDEVYVLSVPDEMLGVPDEGWVFPTATHPLILDLANHVAPGKVDSRQEVTRGARLEGDHGLPFELRAVEVALNGAIQELTWEMMELDAEAEPALQQLVKRISRDKLETVREVKTSLTRLTTRVERIRKELEEILDDDSDMSDMYLSRRAVERSAQALDAETLRNDLAPGGDGFPADDSAPGGEARPLPPEAGQMEPLLTLLQEPSRQSSGASQPPTDAWGGAYPPGGPEARAHSEGTMKVPPGMSARSVGALVDPHSIEACENLLENYFMQAEFLLSRLNQMKERIDDVEDLLNLELDQRRNELVALDMVMTILTMGFAFVAMIAGIFGMNLGPLPIQDDNIHFYVVVIASGFIGFMLCATALAYAQKKRLLTFIPQAV